MKSLLGSINSSRYSNGVAESLPGRWPDRHSATPFEYLEEFIEPRRHFMKQMKHLRQQKPFHIVATFTLALAGIAIPAQAQTFTLLHSFAGYNTDGAYPNGLVQGANGYL